MNKTVFYTIPTSIFVFLLAINTGHALNKKILDVQKNQEKIDLIYYDRFPYKKDYNGIKIPECTRAPARKGQKTGYVLLCKEHIALLRPASVIKLWKHQQRLKGYIPFSMKEFGIINVHAHITGVKEYTQVIKNTITPDSNHVTGKFIRYAPEVNRYTVKDKQTNMTSTVDATPNHPFYVKNKHAFVPISEVLSSDSLVTLSNHEAHLIHSNSNNFPLKTNNKKNKLTRVYNIEIEKKHVYFISKLNLLVHNPCKVLHDYYLYLKKNRVARKFFSANGSSVEISVRRSNIKDLLDNTNAGFHTLFTPSGNLDPEILEKIYHLGFSMQGGDENLSLEEASRINVRRLNESYIITFRLSKRMSLEEYEGKYIPNMLDYYAPLFDYTVSSTGEKNIFKDESFKVDGMATRNGIFHIKDKSFKEDGGTTKNGISHIEDVPCKVDGGTTHNCMPNACSIS